MHALALPAPRVLGYRRDLRKGLRILWMALSELVINSFLDALGNATAYSEAGVWVKLHIGAPGTAGANNPAATTTRMQASFAPAATKSMTTDADILWSNVANAETISHVSLWDASTGGNFLGEQALAASKVLAVGDNFRIPAGSLTVSGT